jgi:hypothetical protein
VLGRAPVSELEPVLERVLGQVQALVLAQALALVRNQRQ